MNNLDLREGIAFSMILGVLCALAVTNVDITPNQRIMSWLVFVVTSGACINIAGLKIWKVIVTTILPAMTLILGLLFIFVLSYLDGNPIIGSAGKLNLEEAQLKTGMGMFSMLAVFHAVLLLLTILGLTVATQSGEVIRKIIRTVLSLDPKDIGKKEKVFNSILRISLTLAALVSIFG